MVSSTLRCRRCSGLFRSQARCSLLATGMLVLLTSHGWAQAGAPLGGLVEDETRAPLPGAEITLTRDTGEVRRTTSDAAGRFVFEQVLAGAYSVEASLPGFGPVKVAVAVTADPPPPVRITMPVRLEEEVTVSASRRPGPLAPESNADAVEFDDEDLLSELPVERQDILSAVANFLSPAAGESGALSVVVDGIESDGLDLPASAVRRLFVNRNPYSVEYRRPGRARVEVLTDRGSRRHYHAGVALFVRDARLNARNPFAQAKPDASRWLSEASLGGTIPRTGVSLFFSGEHLADDESVVVNARTLGGPVIENVETARRHTKAFGRADLTLGERHTVIARYGLKRRLRRNLGVGGVRLADHGFSTMEGEHGLHLVAHGFWSPRLVNDLRVEIARERDEAGHPAERAAIVVLGAFTSGPSQTFRRTRERPVQVQNVATYFRGAHTFRLGGSLQSTAIRVADASNFGGTFEFSSLEEWATGRPFVFRVNRGQPTVSFAAHEASGFFQDDVKLGPHVSVMLGLRYDWQSLLGDRNNVAPRLAVAFAPGTQTTVLRGGLGVFYERLPETAALRQRLVDGSRIRELVIAGPSFPDPFAAGQPRFTPPSVVRIAPTAKAPYLIQASLGVERQLGRRSQVTVEYHLIRGFHLLRARDTNAPAPDTGRRPDPALLNVLQVESSGMRRSHGLDATVRGRIGGWFKGTAHYALSRSIDDSSGLFALPANNHDLRDEVGRADFDRRHRLNLVGIVESPGDAWRLAAVLSVASGAPFDITTGFDDNGDTVANDRPPGVTRNSGQGPGRADLDVRLTRRFEAPHLIRRAGERADLEIRLDAFNALNRTTYSDVVGVQSSPLFGRADSAERARTLQLSVRYAF